jgi:hypothetical protein
MKLRESKKQAVEGVSTFAKFNTADNQDPRYYETMQGHYVAQTPHSWKWVNVLCPYCEVSMVEFTGKIDGRVISVQSDSSSEVGEYFPTIMDPMPANLRMVACRSCNSEFTTPRPGHEEEFYDEVRVLQSGV